MSCPPPRLSPGRSHLVLAASVLLILGLGLLGDWVNPWLEYQRDAIARGQWWRLLTGHMVHLGFVHTVMNLAACLIIVETFKPLASLWWYWWLAQLALFISGGFLLFDANLGFYAGLSGVVHGLLVMAAIEAFACRQIPGYLSVVLLVAVVFKLAYEASPWYHADYLQSYMGAPVITHSHLYGAIGGLLLGLQQLLKRIKRQQSGGEKVML